MKINVKYKPHKEDILVWGVYGPKTINLMLERINQDIQGVIKNLKQIKGVYEQN